MTVEKKPNENGKPKRLELQGIRGMAILSVLGFHFFPSLFPNGYLGVDQFFVLSGFLMYMLVDKSRSASLFSLISTFYWRRFRRILPLYYLVILLGLAAIYTIFAPMFFDPNLQSASNALMFVSNRPKSAAEDYFQQMGTAQDIFKHTWSLSVEIQFYFLFPIMFVVCSLKVPQRFELAAYSVIACASFIFHIVSNSSIAFNNVFARIWQFLLGAIIFMLQKDSSNLHYLPLCTNEKQCADNLDKQSVQDPGVASKLAHYQFALSTSLFSLLLVILFFYMPFNANYARPLATILTAFLMLISSQCSVLTNRPITYIGDISYSLYLIHWPLYTYYKSVHLHDETSTLGLLTFLLISVIGGWLSFELFEKWYLRLSSITVTAIMVGLLTSSVCLIHLESIQIQLGIMENIDIGEFDNVPMNASLELATRFNRVWSKNDEAHVISKDCSYSTGGPFGRCTYKHLNHSNPYKMVLIGNSWAANLGETLYEECKGKANRIVQKTFAGCEPFYATERFKNCPSRMLELLDLVEREEPDYLFVISRYFDVGEPFTSGKMSNDKYYKKMRKVMRRLAHSVKRKLFISDYLPSITNEIVFDLAGMVHSNLTKPQIDEKLLKPMGWANAKRRLHMLFKECGDKCRHIDLVKPFWRADENSFRFYDDSGVSYFTTQVHFTPHGKEKIRPLFTQICENLD